MSHTIDINENLNIEKLLEPFDIENDFVQVARNRRMVILTDCDDDPFVIRSTTPNSVTNYMCIPDIYLDLMDQLDMHWANNIMVEIYDASSSRNAKINDMGWHTDCAIDLDPNYDILIMGVPFGMGVSGLLDIKHKSNIFSTEYQTIDLTNSTIRLSYQQNLEHVHRIRTNNSRPEVVNDNRPEVVDDSQKWLCITFRKSIKKLSDLRPINNKSEEREFIRLKSEENKTLGGINWPQLPYYI